MAGPLYAYGSYHPAMQLQNLSSGRECGGSREIHEPGEVFDMLLRKECEKNSRRIHTPQHTTGFNQFNFMRAGSTLAIVASQLTLNPRSAITPSSSAGQGNDPVMPTAGFEQDNDPVMPAVGFGQGNEPVMPATGGDQAEMSAEMEEELNS